MLAALLKFVPLQVPWCRLHTDTIFSRVVLCLILAMAWVQFMEDCIAETEMFWRPRSRANARIATDNPLFMLVSGMTAPEEMCLTVADGSFLCAGTL